MLAVEFTTNQTNGGLICPIYFCVIKIELSFFERLVDRTKIFRFISNVNKKDRKKKEKSSYLTK